MRTRWCATRARGRGNTYLLLYFSRVIIVPVNNTLWPLPPPSSSDRRPRTYHLPAAARWTAARDAGQPVFRGCVNICAGRSPGAEPPLRFVRGFGRFLNREVRGVKPISRYEISKTSSYNFEPIFYVKTFGATPPPPYHRLGARFPALAVSLIFVPGPKKTRILLSAAGTRFERNFPFDFFPYYFWGASNFSFSTAVIPNRRNVFSVIWRRR